jgi:zinc-ribbon domain
MYCPQCGVESPSDQNFCRSCGANLKVIGKAVALSEAVARSDRGALPKLKEMMESAKIRHATEEVSRALDQVNREITKGLARSEHEHPWWIHFTEKKSPARRREDRISRGIISFFSGVGLMVFLYYLCGALVLKIPPETLARLPFEVEPLVRIAWLVGLIPTLTGLGRIVAGLTIKPAPPADALEGEKGTRPRLDAGAREQTIPAREQTAGAREQRDAAQGRTRADSPPSVVENTTELLEERFPQHGGQ